MPNCPARGGTLVLAGAALAIVAGIGYNAAAALQKREAVQVEASVSRLLGALVRRKWWVIATAASLVAWVAQAAAMALAPIAMVMPVMGLGAGLLVALGIRWLGERFTRREIAGVALVVAGGAAAAIAIRQIPPARAPLSTATLLALGAATLVIAAAISRMRTGLGYGLAAGSIFTATAIYTKEIGDRFAQGGWSAFGTVLTGSSLWLLIGLSVAGIALVQAGYQRANAASVAAAVTAVDSAGPILAGFFLYHERYPAGGSGVALAAALAAALAGMILLAGTGAGSRGLDSAKPEVAR